MQNISMQYWESAPRKAKTWYKDFMKAEEFKILTKQQQFHSRNVIMSFAEGVYNWEAERPEDWDEHGVACCCLDIFQMKSIVDESFIESIAPVLINFFEFIYNKGYNNYGHNLAECVKKNQEKMVRSLKRIREMCLDEILGLSQNNA